MFDSWENQCPNFGVKLGPFNEVNCTLPTGHLPCQQAPWLPLEVTLLREGQEDRDKF